LERLRPGWPAFKVVVVLPGEDQLTQMGAGAFTQARGLAGLELASVEQVALDAAGQVKAFAVFERGEYHVSPG